MSRTTATAKGQHQDRSTTHSTAQGRGRQYRVEPVRNTHEVEHRGTNDSDGRHRHAGEGEHNRQQAKQGSSDNGGESVKIKASQGLSSPSCDNVDYVNF
ncbi:MAG: hypothetical protein FP827_02210 [Candidatus Omnitrophica bacterium]|nr:hypothetical protein [Candidatus Omnitrophota bacterium]